MTDKFNYSPVWSTTCRTELYRTVQASLWQNKILSKTEIS